MHNTSGNKVCCVKRYFRAIEDVEGAGWVWHHAGHLRQAIACFEHYKKKQYCFQYFNSHKITSTVA